ncbi:hypothetical protein DPMN_135169 [Dreissena polymorpha]|uniref:Uncharacterized protein n=1 Tax=Dreissena polymorpha TaxID=45954 RepID=A0A9D4JBD5_DREPO|nr:hypothetical protein DPMN_135169 [Dreissena polymorpha]
MSPRKRQTKAPPTPPSALQRTLKLRSNLKVHAYRTIKKDPLLLLICHFQMRKKKLKEVHVLGRTTPWVITNFTKEEKRAHN